MALAIAAHVENFPPELRRQVRQALEGVRGIARVLVDRTEPKFYVVLEQTDMERDRTIVSKFARIERELGQVLDYDLVPLKSEGMIPDSERL
jgi:hypothetical protein